MSLCCYAQARFYMNLKSGFSRIFLMIGVILLTLFVAADIVEVEVLNPLYLLFGVLFTGVGIFLLLAGRETPEESARFRTLRKLAGRKRKGEEDENGNEEE